jgi:hypothetical protein
MVRIEEAPAVIAVGLAEIVTFAGGFADTVTVTVAVAVPPAPVAVAVYVVVAAGLTACVPPVVGRLYELPSEPVTVTCVALVALIERVDEFPDPIVAGLAEMLIVGAGFPAGVTVTIAVAETFPEAAVAAAVYVVVFDGLTGCVPPVALSWYEVPSDPVTVTPEEFVAVTVRVDALPAVMVVGEATMLTVAGLLIARWVEPHPAAKSAKRRTQTGVKTSRLEILNKCTRGNLYSILSLDKAHSSARFRDSERDLPCRASGDIPKSIPAHDGYWVVQGLLGDGDRWSHPHSYVRLPKHVG